MYFAYIIYSASLDRYYIGHSSDVNRRLISHNKGSNKYTKRGMPWRLVFKKEFKDKSEAIKFELYIKSMKSKKFIENLIAVG